MDEPESDAPVVIGPRQFGGRRDVLVATVFAVAFVVALAAAFTIGTPGVVGTFYVLAAFAVWVQDFRRSYRISAERIEERRWFRWQTVPGVEVVSVTENHDDMGPRAVVVTGSSGTLEVSLDDCRTTPELARALRSFVASCEQRGADVDQSVHRTVG